MEPFRRSDRAGWWVRFKDADGRWLTRKGGDTKRQAYVALERLELEARMLREGWVDRQDHAARKAARRPVADVLAEYEAYLRAKGNTAAHVTEAMRCCEAGLDATGARCLADVTAAAVERWLNGMIERGRSPRTRNVYLIRLRGLLNWAVRNGELPRNPLVGVETVREARDRREVSRALTPEEFERLLAATPDEGRRAYYLLAGRCGLRWGEIRRLRWDDLDLERGWIDLRADGTKSERAEAMPMGSEVVESLRRLGGEGGTVFESSPTLRTFKRDLERAGIPYETSRGQADRKCLRKTFGTHLAMAGVDFRIGVRLLRHSDPRLTMSVYTDPMLLDMQAAVEKLQRSDGPERAAAS